ncbi:MAG: HI0074 family nucleotidyltransferase substrate-binding subunit [Bdellovibrionota bacterium]
MKESLNQWSSSLARLNEALNQSPSQNPLALDGTIQRFEFSFDLGWKTIKRFLEFEGIQEKNPREVLAAAFQQGWLNPEGDSFWYGMIEDRSRTSHTYNLTTAEQVYARIPDYLKAFERVRDFLSSQIAGP